MNLFSRLSSKEKYSDYLRRINPEKVLDHYGAENSFEIETSNGTEVQHSCLIDRVQPHHTNGDRNPSARMNLDKKLYICYSLGGGDIFWFIKMMEGKETFEEILPLLGQFLDGSTESKENFLEELESYFKDPDVEEHSIPTYSDRVLKQWAVTHPYLINQRGISHEAATRLKVGYDDQERRIVFPLFFGGELLGWQKRAVPEGLGYPATQEKNGVLAKYKNTPNFPKSKSLYNYDLVEKRGRREVVVVESPMSVLKAETLTDGEDLLSCVVATLGAKVSDFQINYLRKFDRVYVYMDNDPAGNKGEQYLTRGLYRHTDCLVVEAEEGRDLADYDSRSEVLDRISKAVPAFLKLAEWDREKGKRKRS